MLSFTAVRRIFLARQSTDMRRGIDTLSSLVVSELGHDPFAGDCFVFVGRDRRRLKVLVWETGGFWLCLKRLESGTFPLPRDLASQAGAALTVTPSQMHALLEGIAVERSRQHRRWSPSRRENTSTTPTVVRE
jgi:transposase